MLSEDQHLLTGTVKPGFHVCWKAGSLWESQNHRIVGVGRDLCGSSSLRGGPRPGRNVRREQGAARAGVGRAQPQPLGPLLSLGSPLLRVLVAVVPSLV